MHVIYLASPYSHPDSRIRAERYDAVSLLAANIIVKTKGQVMPFAPITHSHPLFVLCPETGADFKSWQAFDEFMIRACDELWVLTLDGWDKSVGVTAEIEYAKSLGKHVEYVHEGQYD